MLDLFSLKDKVAIATGAAQGIGREIALGFAQYGADIAAVDLNEERLLTLKSKIEAKPRVLSRGRPSWWTAVFAPSGHGGGQ